jgi:flagellar basal body-associated protein FliL
MPAVPFALSIHHFISSVGADAGFAAIIGLALLVLLLFSQARETASLRRRAADAEDALHRLELYVDQLARRPAPAPAPTAPTAPTAAGAVRAPIALPPSAATAIAPTGAPVGSRVAAGGLAEGGLAEGAQAGGVATIPAAPAGVGAPALSAATRLIPGPDPISIRALHGPGDPAAPLGNGNGNGPVPTPVPVPVPVPVPAAARAGDPVPVASGTQTAVAEPPYPPPSTAAGGASGTGGAGGAGPSGQRPPGARQQPLPPRMRLDRPGRGLRGRSSGSSRVSRPVIVIVIVTVLVLVVIVVGLIVATSGSSTNSPASSTTASSSSTTKAKTKAGARKHGATVTINPATVAVAVLNGTNTTNLAHDVMGKLTAVGYKQASTPATASDQNHTTTIVGYLPGFAPRRAARRPAPAPPRSSSRRAPMWPPTRRRARARRAPQPAEH